MKKLFTLLCVFSMGSTAFSQVVNTFPYVQDFESFPTCGTGGATACPLPGPWFNNLANDDIDWTVDVNGTGSSNTGPTANSGADHNPGVAGGVYLYLETSSPVGTGDNALLESPWFDFTALAAPSLSYWYHMYGTSMGTMSLDIRTSLSGAWTLNVVGPLTDNQDVWQEQIVNLIAYAGEDSVQFRWNGVYGTSFGGDMALDDVMVFQPDPFDLSYDGVDNLPLSLCAGMIQGSAVVIHEGSVVINAGDSILVNYMDGTNTFNEYYVLGANFNPGDTLLIPFSSMHDFTVAGSYNAVTYINYAGDASNLNDTLAAVINAAPTINTFPYLEDFENGSGGWTATNGPGGNWEMGMPAGAIINSAYSDSNAWVTGLSADYNSGTADSWVEGPCFDFTTATGQEWVSLAVFRETEDSWDGANLTYSTDGGNTWALLGAFGDPDWYTDNSINGAPAGSQDGWEGSSFGWEIMKHPLDSAVFVGNADVKFRVNFGSDGSVTQEGIAFDNFAIAYPISADVIVGDSLFLCDTLYSADAGTGWTSVSWSTGGSNQIDTIATNGTYTVSVFDMYGMCAVDTFAVVFADFIPPNLMDWDFVCAGDTLIIDAGADSLTSYAYLWSTTESSQTIAVTTGGTYFVTKTDIGPSGCTATDTIDIILPPVADLGPGIQEVCPGTPITLDASVTNAASYLWSTGDNTQTTSVSTPGGYSVTVTDTFGCMTISAVSLVDGTPTVILGNDLVLCADDMVTLDAGNAGASYLWSTNETTQTILIDAANLGVGSYTYDVVVTSPGAGCFGQDQINITVNACTGVEDILDGVSVEMFPNPTSGELQINITDANQTDMVISVMNLQGQVIESRQLNNSGASYTVDFDLTDLASGMYMIKFQNENGAMMQRIIKQ